MTRRKQPPVAIECKWSASDFDPKGVKAFRKQYEKGETFVVAHDVDHAYGKTYGNVRITFINLADLIQKLKRAFG